MPKKVDKNLPEENAGTKRLTGTFNAPPPLCLGDVFSDKRRLDDRHKGKQVSCGVYQSDEATKLCAPGTFKLQPFLFSNADMKGKEPYKENFRYILNFPNGDQRPRGAPKCGFQSTDFARRDQYTNTIATEQARTSYRSEMRINKKSMVEEAKRLQAAGINRPSTAMPEGIRKVGLYDLVYRVPELGLMAQKLPRDDRQARFFFMAQRLREKGLTNIKAQGLDGSKLDPRLDQLQDLQLQKLTGAKKEKKRNEEGSVWVSMVLPTGKRMLVQMDETRTNILDKRPMTA